MLDPTRTADDTVAIIRQAFQLANQAVICDIESEAHRIDRDGRTWWDTRPMTDLREHSPVFVDMAQQAIDYAVHTGLACTHPACDYLLSFDPHTTRDKRHLTPAQPGTSLLRLALDILDPEAYGHAVTAEVRAAARAALGVTG